MRKIVVIIGMMLTCLAATWALPKVQQPLADAQIAQLSGQGWKIEGACLSYDARTLYLSMCKAPRTVYDLYTCSLVNGQWQTPVRINELSTETDEWSPTISSDEQTLYFIRRDVLEAGTRKEQSGNMIYCAQRQKDGQWQAPEWMLISNGQDSQLHLYPDNKLLTFFSKGREAESNRNEHARCYYVCKLNKYNWTTPKLLNAAPETLMTPVKTLTGQVVDQQTGQPMQAQTEVYNAITQQLIARHNTDEKGNFCIALPTGEDYRVEVSQPGYSKVYIRPANDAEPMNERVELSPELTLNIRVFDKEELTPLSYHLTITNQQTNHTQQIQAERSRKPVQLTIGQIYSLSLTRQGYADTTYLFDTRRDVLVTQTDVDLYMRCGKVQTQLLAVDEDTHEPIDAQYKICPYEEGTGAIGQTKNVPSNTSLPCSQTYQLNISASGYLFHDTIFTTLINEGQQVVEVKMMPIRKALVVQLRNIEFEYNSYLLKEESYNELHRVAELMRMNPSLTIELSAHTDDIGPDEYNQRLSEKRGNSVMTYLIEEENIAPERLTSKGYGKSHPLVPNTSSENRRINRRVEFTIIEL